MDMFRLVMVSLAGWGN